MQRWQPRTYFCYNDFSFPNVDFFSNSNILLVDATNEEERLATGAVTVVAEGENLLSIYKPGICYHVALF